MPKMRTTGASHGAGSGNSAYGGVGHQHGKDTAALRTQPWRAALDSVRRFHGFPPAGKQRRHVVVGVSEAQRREASNGRPYAVSMRQSATLIKLSGGYLDEPVDEMMRTLHVQVPCSDVVPLVHEIAVLAAEYYDLLRQKRSLLGVASTAPAVASGPATGGGLGVASSSTTIPSVSPAASASAAIR